MARARQRSKTRSRSRGAGRGATPAQRSAQMREGRLEAPGIDWNSPPEQVRLPDIKDLRGMSPSELRGVLQRFGIVESWPQMRAAAAGYVQRMSNIPAGSAAFAAEVDRLCSAAEGRGLLSMARRAYHEYSTIYAMDGDPNTVFIRIPEADDSSCDRCIELGGEEGTYGYHKSIGSIGSGSCAGGDLCRCELYSVG